MSTDEAKAVANVLSEKKVPISGKGIDCDLAARFLDPVVVDPHGSILAVASLSGETRRSR